jgi:hypothetical protein
MKKRNLKSLKLNEKSIANFSIKGGSNAEDTTDGSEEAMITWYIEGCLTWSVIQNTACTCT